MDRKMIAYKVRRYWEVYFPRTAQTLKDNGQFDTTVRDTARRISAEIADLTATGYSKFDAERIVLPMYILSGPDLPEDNN